MRNIIFTENADLMATSKVMAAAGLLVLTLATPAATEPTFGCYERVYSDQHLAGQPDQVVRELRLYLTSSESENMQWTAGMEVISANQGHAARDGLGAQRFTQFLICWEDDGRRGCSVECDGGSLMITKDDANGLTFRTDYLMVGDTGECGGALDLAEKVGQAVSYRLSRVAEHTCAAISGM